MEASHMNEYYTAKEIADQLSVESITIRKYAKEVNEMKYIVWVTVITLMVVATGCKMKDEEPTANQAAITKIQQPTNASTPTEELINDADMKQTGFFASNEGSAMFIQWTELDNKLTGQLINTFVNASSDPLKMDNQNASFSGIHNGNSISLTFDGDKTLTGTIENNRLILVFPSNDGTLESFVLIPGTVNEYNQAVTTIQAMIKDSNNKEARLKADVQRLNNEHKAVIDKNARLNDALAALHADSKYLSEETTYADLLKEYDNALLEMTKNYDHLKVNASVSPLTGVQLGTVQANLGTLEADLGAFQTINGSMDVRTTSINDLLLQTQKDILAVQEQFKALQVAISNDTTGTKTQYTSDNVTNEINTAQKKIDSAHSIMQAAQKKASEYYKNAQNTLGEATQFVEGLRAID